MRVGKGCLSLIAAANVLLAQGERGGGPGGRGGERAITASEVSVPGDPARGEAIFQGKGGCAACHRARDKGSRLGPDLSEVATRRTVEDLQKALLDPSPAVQPQNRAYRVVTKDGATITGKIMNQDQFSLQMLDANERLVAFPKSNLREYGFIQTAPMPSYRGKLAPDEITDLIGYLASLKGPVRN